MHYDDCPLPAVADALRPYVRPRSEVDSIRQELQTYLEVQLGEDHVPLTTVNLSSPTNTPSHDPPSAISGVRKAYWRALQAHNAAQARYDTLKSDLANLESSPKSDTGSHEATSTIHKTYVPLLRQREKQRKLHILERSFVEIDNASKGLSAASLDDVVKQRLGDPPMPPSTLTPVFGEKPDMDAKVLLLKQAILSAKYGLDEQVRARVGHKLVSGSSPSVDAEINGLQSALGELTSWMETQLGLIGGADTEAPPPPQTPGQNDDGTFEVPPIEDIERLYEDYLAARRKLISTVHSPSTFEANMSALSITTNSQSSPHPLASKPSASEIVLAHIPVLAWSKREEASLLQQSTFLRRQIASAELQTERLVARLADESHLVHPGTADGKGWADAAMEADKAIVRSLQVRLQAGKGHTKAANKSLVDIQKVPTLFHGVVANES